MSLLHPSSPAGPRIHYLDYLRGFMVLLVVLDHSLHGYTRYFADTWFIQDYERSEVLDFLHLHNDAVMMPFMFFLAGLFVFPSLERRGVRAYMVERFWRLGVPLAGGIICIAPWMNHAKEVAAGHTQSFFEFWQSIILTFNNYPLDKANAAGFWFLTYLILLTLGVILLYTLFPPLRRALAQYGRWIIKCPFPGLLSVIIIVSLLTVVSDWIWGAPFWFVYKPFFGVRKARFLAKAFFFLMGVAMADAGFLKDTLVLKRLKAAWPLWTLGACSVFIVYAFFVLSYINEGVFNMPIPYYAYQFQTFPSWDVAWSLIQSEGLLASLRAALLGVVMVILSVFYLSFFGYFLNKPSRVWYSLAACSYGIYIFHEPLVTAVNLFYLNDPLPAIFKFLMAASFSLGCAWTAVHYMLKVPAIKRIIG